MTEKQNLYESTLYSGLSGYDFEHMRIAERRLQQACLKPRGELDLSHLSLASLPDKALSEMSNLRILNLQNNRLTTLPESLKGLVHLRELSLAGNDFATLPDFLGKFSNLRILALGGNQLHSLPDTIGEMTLLETLEAGNNHLTELSGAMERLIHLRNLGLDSNKFAAVPQCLEKLARLEKLNLHNNKLQYLPVFLGLFANLQELRAGRNELVDLPAQIGQLNNLTVLDLHSNLLTSIPETVTHLAALEVLMLYGNQLTTLPASLGDLAHLRELLLTDNKLTSLPDSLGALHELERLSLFNNELVVLPDTLDGLVSLQSLHVNANKLKSLPSTLGALQALRELWVFDNQLSELPGELLHLVRRGTLKELYLQGNDALGLPEAVMGAHWERVAWNKAAPAPPLEILEYYFTMRGGPVRTLRELKVILVGRGEVGKTTIAEVLQGRRFERNRPITQGISITPWEVDLKDGVEGGRATAHLWDFGGQQIMHGTHQFFMTHRALYLVVLDGRDDRTKQEAEYWLKLVRAFGGESSRVLLVLNKQGERPYEIDGEYFVKKYGIAPQHIFRTECADEKDAGIDLLRRSICEEAAKLLANRELFPGAWWEIKKYLASMRERKEDFLSEEQYHELCSDKMVKPDQCASLLRVLSELGVVVSFPDDMSLAHLLVLNPEWVTDGVYRVLNDRDLVEKKRGQLTMAALERILPADRWKRPKHRKYILDLMAKFELCFPMEGKSNTVLVPELLPDATPRNLGAWEADECVVFLYRYPALPQGVLPRFITRTHDLSEGRERWRSGVVLERQGAEALVRADYDRNELSIWVRGRPGPVNRELMAIGREHLEVIHGRFEHLGEEALLTVPGQPEVTVPLGDVLEDEEAGRRSMRLTVAGFRCDVPIKELLEGVDIKKDKKKRKLGKVIDDVRLRSSVGDTFNIQSAVIHQGNKIYTDMSEHKTTNVELAAGATSSGIIGDGNAMQGNTGNTQTFTNCYNSVQQLPIEKAELKSAMEGLLKEVQALQLKLEEKAQAKLEKNLEKLTEEATAEEPDPSWLKVSGKGLIEAAETCATLAGPVVMATKKLLELFQVSI
jgi:internalin A